MRLALIRHMLQPSWIEDPIKVLLIRLSRARCVICEAACQRLPHVAPDSAATAAAATKLMMFAFGTWDPSVKLEERQMEAL